MIKYVTIVGFTDLQDSDYKYEPGMIYPRSGLDVSEERIEALASGLNLRGVRLIAELKGLEDELEVTETSPEKNTRKKKESTE